MKDMNRDFRKAGPDGLVSGRRDTGGAPNVTQWILLKQPVRMLSSDSASGLVDSMWQ